VYIDAVANAAKTAVRACMSSMRMTGPRMKPRDDTRRIQSRQNGETGTDRVTKDTVRSREKVSSGANFIFAFSDAMS